MPATKSSAIRILLVVVPLLLIGGLAYSLPRNVWEAVGIAPKKVDNELPPCCQARGIAAKDAATEFALTTEAKPSIAADEGGRVFVAWAQSAGENEWQIFLASSLDGGVKFDPPRPVVSTNSNPEIVVSIDNNVRIEYTVAGKEADSSKWMMVASSNGGLTFEEPQESTFRIGTQPSDRADIEDANRNVHEVWSEEIPATDKASSTGTMIMYRTAAAMSTFSEPKGVLPRQGATQKNPAIAIAKDTAVVAFCETKDDKTKIVITRVK